MQRKTICAPKRLARSTRVSRFIRPHVAWSKQFPRRWIHHTPLTQADARARSRFIHWPEFLARQPRRTRALGGCAHGVDPLDAAPVPRMARVHPPHFRREARTKLPHLLARNHLG